MQYEYYYQELDRREKQVYRGLMEAISKHESMAVVENGGALASVNRVVRALDYDHPELYYWDCRNIVIKTRGNQMAIKLDYYLNKEEISKNKPKIERGIAEILGKCKSQYDSEYDRFKSIYDCMVRNLEYEYSADNGKDIESVFYPHTVLGVFARKRAVCDGISKAFKLVLEKSGIDCIVVRGTKREQGADKEGHAWNIVWIDDKPCHVDLTWAIEQSNKKVINNDYVGLTDKQIQKDHGIDNVLKVPKCNSEELDFYIRNNAVIKRESDLPLYLKKHAEHKPFEINVRLDFQCNMEDMEKKAVDYVITHYVLGNQHVKITSHYREDQNNLIMTGR